MQIMDDAAGTGEPSALVKSRARWRRFGVLARRLWVLPALTLFTLAVLAALLVRAAPAEAQTVTRNLTLIKTGPLSAQIGTQIVYTLTLRNTGVGTVNNITVTEQTPNGLVFDGFGGACSGATCTFASLGTGASRTIRVTYTIPSTYDLLANPIITNTAFVSTTSSELTLLDNRGVWASLPVAYADLELTKQANSDVIARGENVTYTLTLTNNGPNTAFAVSILDLMTPTLPFVSGSDSPCSFVPLLTGTIALCNNVTAGTSVVLTAVHAVPLDWVTPTVKNTGLAGSLSIDPNYFNNVASTTITITSRADISITKEGPPEVVPGTDAVFTLTVKNLGPSKALTVTVDDAGFNDLDLVTDDTCVEYFPCNLGTMFPNSVTQIVMTFTIPSSFTGTEVVNTASATSPITDPDELNNTSTVTVPVVYVSDLGITKEGPATAVPGTLITYTVVVTNNGPSDAYEVTLTDMNPEGLASADNPCEEGVCNLPDLPVGVSTTLAIVFDIDPFLRGTVTNTASVTSTGTPTPAVATTTAELTPEADLALDKTDGLTEAAFGSELTYTIVITNDGPSGVVDAVISDTMPALFEDVEWTCAAFAPNACTPDEDGGDIDALLTVAPGSTVTFTVNGWLVTSSDETLLSNTAMITAPAMVTDTNVENNISTDQTNLVYVTDLSITKTVTPADSIAPGELFTYSLVVVNAGPSKANSATLTDWMPWSIEGAQWSCEADDDAECSAGSGWGDLVNVPITMEPDSLVEFTITGTLNLFARDSIYNHASIVANPSASDPNKDNNNAWVETPIQSKVFVGIEKTNGQTIAVPGTTLTYVITLTNQGPSIANGTLNDIFPPELSNAVWQWGYDGKAGIMGDVSQITSHDGVEVMMYPGSLLTVSVSTSVNLTASGWLTNTALFSIGLESPGEGNGGCATACGVVPQGQLPSEDGPLPIINTNPVTQATDVDQIVPALVTGKIYNDLDGNGVFNTDDPPLLGVRVWITGNGVSAVEVTVDAGGWFTQVVPPGSFSYSVVPGSVPAGYVLTSNNDSGDGTASSGENFTGFIGYQGRGAVDGVAFNDINGNREQDPGEAGLPGITVTLTGFAGGNVPSSVMRANMLSTTTDANGNYSFENVGAGGYNLNVILPAGFVNTTPLPQNIIVQPNGATTNPVGMQVPGALSVSKLARASGNGGLLGVDRLITYTLLITNNGGGLLNSVLVTDTLESYLQFVNGSATPAPLWTSPLVWQIGSLLPGEHMTIQFVTRVNDGFTGVVLNTAIAGSSQTLAVQSNESIVHPSPTAISIVRFAAQREAEGVTVMWETGFERNTFGFNLLRSATGNRADAIQVNATLIPAGGKGSAYAFVDAFADPNVTYTYWLQEIELDGTVNDYAEMAVVQGATGQAVPAYRVFMPVLMR